LTVSAAGCILHTDRESRFLSRKFVHALHHHDMAGSMGKVGAAGDNAAMESFFALLQKNVWTAASGRSAKNCDSRSSPGSSGPTTAVADRQPSAD
jgi:transposase InsO family protein